MFSSLKFHLWLTYVLVLGVMMVIAGISMGLYVLGNPPQDRRELQRLRIMSNILIQDGVVDQPENQLDIDLYTNQLQSEDDLLNARITIYKGSGELLADSRKERAPPLPEWAYFAGRDRNSRPTYMDVLGREWLMVVSPLDDGSILLVSSWRPQPTIPEVLREGSITIFLRVLLLALFVTSILAIWVVQRTATSVQGTNPPPNQ